MDDLLRRGRFGRAVRALRRDLGLNQTEFADRVNLTQTVVSRIELGQVEPEPNQVFTLERDLGVPAGSLSRYLGYVPVDPADAPEPATVPTDHLPFVTIPDIRLPVIEVPNFKVPVIDVNDPGFQATLKSLQGVADQINATIKPLIDAIAATTVVYPPGVKQAQAAQAEAQRLRDLADDAAGKPRRRTKKVSDAEPSSDA